MVSQACYGTQGLVGDFFILHVCYLRNRAFLVKRAISLLDTYLFSLSIGKVYMALVGCYLTHPGC